MHNVGSLEKCMLFKLSLCVRNNRSCSRYLPNATIYGFDSFQGLPEDWDIGIGRTTLKETFDMSTDSVFFSISLSLRVSKMESILLMLGLYVSNQEA